MSEITIITDHKWKDFKYAYDVPQSVLEDYDHLDDNADGWINYRRCWYHLSDFMDLHNKVHMPAESPFKTLGYDGVHNDSFFSGVLIKISDDCEQYKIATFIS